MFYVYIYMMVFSDIFRD